MKWVDLENYPNYKNEQRYIGIVYMSPDSFLSKVPPVISDFEEVKKENPKMTRKNYEKFKKEEEDTTYFEKKLRKGEALIPPQIFIGSKENEWLSHEGRHRVLLAKKLGEEEVPIAVYWWGGHRGDEGAKKILDDIKYSKQGSHYIGMNRDEVIERIMKIRPI